METTQLDIDSLRHRLDLNRAAQDEIAQNMANQSEARQQLVNKINQSCGAVFDLIGIYGELPTLENKRQLAEARRTEELANRELKDFDISSSNDDLGLLIDNENIILNKIKQLKTHEGNSCYSAELETVKEKLRILFPRYIALSAVVFGVGPFTIDVESLSLKDLNYRATLETEFKKLQEELDNA